MRRLTYFVATTLDGFISRADGTFGDFPWDEAYVAALLESFPETFPARFRPGAPTRADNRRFDAVLMGRRTYEVGLREGIASPYPTLDQYVFSRTIRESLPEGVTLVRDEAAEFVARLKEQPGKAIWLCGGADLASVFFAANLVDELIVKLNPVLFGSGIPLLGPADGPVELELTETFTHPSGHVRLHYDVRPS
jgi:dihydrofolate reductase